MASAYQPYHDITAYATKRLAEATDKEIARCYALTMEDKDDSIANKIRSEHFERQRRAQHKS